MKGDGTQENPYIPETLSEFITAVGTSGAYVALDQDINAADDPAYTGELNSRIELLCTEMDGREHTIKGITVRADSFFYQTRAAACRIKNVNMINMCHKKNRNNPYYTIIGEAHNYVDFYQVKLSIKVEADQNWNDFCGFTSLTHSAFFIEYTGVGFFNRGVFVTSSINQSTIYIKNIASSGSILLQFNNWYSRNAFILDSPRNDVTLTSRNNTAQYCYYAIINCDNNISVNCGESSIYNLVTTDSNDNIITLASGWTQVSFDQLKDKEYLSSIGWLP